MQDSLTCMQFLVGFAIFALPFFLGWYQHHGWAMHCLAQEKDNEVHAKIGPTARISGNSCKHRQLSWVIEISQFHLMTYLGTLSGCLTGDLSCCQVFLTGCNLVFLFVYFSSLSQSRVLLKSIIKTREIVPSITKLRSLDPLSFAYKRGPQLKV